MKMSQNPHLFTLDPCWDIDKNPCLTHFAGKSNLRPGSPYDFLEIIGKGRTWAIAARLAVV